MLQKLIIFLLKIYLRKIIANDDATDFYGETNSDVTEWETHWSDNVRCYNLGEFIPRPQEISCITIRNESILVTALRILEFKSGKYNLTRLGEYK
jgi:hypothetical protein